MNGKICKLVLMVLLQVSLCYGQHPVYSDLASDDAFEEAHQFSEFGQFEDAVEAYLEVANLNPGTELEAVARFLAVAENTRRVHHSGDLPTEEPSAIAFASDQYDLVIQNLPDTQYSFLASFYKAKITSPEDELTATDMFLTEQGLTSLSDILSNQRTHVSPQQYRDQIAYIYYASANLAPTVLEQEYVYLFIRENFPDWNYKDPIEILMRRRAPEVGIEPGAGTTLPEDEEEPSLVSFLPEPGESVPPESSIVLSITDGPWWNSQIDVASVSLTLDAQELSPQIQLSSSLGDPEGNSEVLTIKYDSLPLSPGVRVATLKVKDRLGQELVHTWSFIVIASPPPNQSLNLTTSHDSVIRAQKPHRNEGANPLLMLSHRPDIRNKSNNPIVGFDFTDVNLNGLTKATLVLNIQECDIPKRWGKKGRRIEAHPVNEPWVEGNGKHLKVQGQKTRGDGQGVTWFSPVDNDISNKQPDGALQWMGARPYLGPVTAPPVRVKNRQTGPVEFDVTADVQAGFRDGWLLRKKNEAKFGNIRFYSKEGAAEAGNPDLAPRLILEYGGSSADAGTNAGQSVASSGHNYLKAVTRTTEGSTIKEVLQENATVAYTGQLLLTMPLNKAPVAQAAVRTAYRSWLNDSLTLANLAQNLA